MIHGGWGTDSAVAGDAGMRYCPVCYAQKHFDIVVNYRYDHLMHFISWVSKRKYSMVCSNCHTAIPDSELINIEIADKLAGKKDPIPFMRRRGWLVVVVAFILLILPAVFWSHQSSQDRKEFERRIAAPQVGDIYLADLSKIIDGYKNDPPAYGAMKLTSLGKNSAHFVASHTAYSTKKESYDAASKGLIKSDTYYKVAANAVADLTPAQLVRLSQQGVIYKVIR